MLLQNEGLSFITALITLTAGALLIILHTIWVHNWRVVITFLAWGTFLKGLLRLFFLERYPQWVIPLIQNRFVYYTIALCSIVLSIYLGYYGFYQPSHIEQIIIVENGLPYWGNISLSHME